MQVLQDLGTDHPVALPLTNSAFLSPRHLSVTPQKVRALLIGQCIFAGWASILSEDFDDVEIEAELFNNAWNLRERDCSDLDFQIVSVPLRAVLHEALYMRLDYADIAGHQAVFAEACERLKYQLNASMAYNREQGVTTFVGNFLVPIANPLGRLMPRYDIRNIQYVVEELNKYLSTLVAGYDSAYVLDLDQIASATGKRFMQDDSVSVLSHNAILANHAIGWDAQRIQPPPLNITEMFMADERGFINVAWNEIMSMYRTIGGRDAVKMVVMDLDDTLWRGVAGDAGGIDALQQVEGWPLGVAEALSFLRKRGVILAIASKNEEKYIREIWPYGGKLELEDFAFLRINWRPKAENVAELIRLANVLPSSVVFVDDNPVERRAVTVANPGVRAIGSEPYLIRSALLWSSETQVPFVTEESGRRNSMMKAQELREATREAMSREEFLETQDIRLKITAIDHADPHFPRAFELLNKTNQFNTTGKRWTDAELRGAMDAGLRLHCFYVVDRFSDYGLTGIILMQGTHIVQVAMSCRVLGMDAEIAALNIIGNQILAAATSPVEVRATLVQTKANFPCRDLYERAGYALKDDLWSKQIVSPLPIPPHLTIL